jgi:hypothetical protein
MQDSPHSRWAVYAQRPGTDSWQLRGVYTTQVEADRRGQLLRPRLIVPINTKGRPPERFADQAALERWFGVEAT